MFCDGVCDGFGIALRWLCDGCAMSAPADFVALFARFPAGFAELVLLGAHLFHAGIPQASIGTFVKFL